MPKPTLKLEKDTVEKVVEIMHALLVASATPPRKPIEPDPAARGKLLLMRAAS